MRWLPFQLNPDLPEEGIPRSVYLERKFGSGGPRPYGHLTEVGREVGIAFDFEAITVQPNTLQAHRLMMYGLRNGREDEVAESLFRAYFTEGAVICDRAVLAQIGERAGLERMPLEAYLASDEDRDTVLRTDVDARQAGINGVPFFIFNRKLAVSGAHEPATLLGAMLQSLED